jgi:DNA-binding MarR family transcriptional regulator
MYAFEMSDSFLASWVLVRQTWSLMHNASAARLRQLGLTPEQTDVLWAIKEHPGPVNPAEISRILYRESQTVASLLNSMQKAGLVQRKRRQEGAPFTEVILTDKGRNAIERAIPESKRLVYDVMSALSDEENAELRRLLQMLVNHTADTLGVQMSAPPGYSQGENIHVDW